MFDYNTRLKKLGKGANYLDIKIATTSFSLILKLVPSKWTKIIICFSTINDLGLGSKIGQDSGIAWSSSGHTSDDSWMELNQEIFLKMDVLIEAFSQWSFSELWLDQMSFLIQFWPRKIQLGLPVRWISIVLKIH